MVLTVVLTALAMAGRREFIQRSAVTAAAISCGACFPAGATLTGEIREGEAALNLATTNRES